MNNKNCGGAFSAYLKTPPQPFAITQASYITALSLAKHIYSAPLCKGELLLLNQAQPTIEGLLPPPAPFPPSPPFFNIPRYAPPKFKSAPQAQPQFFIIHYSLFIISHLLRLRQHHDSPLAFLLSVLRNISVPLISAPVFKPEYLSCCARHNLLFDCFNHA